MRKVSSVPTDSVLDRVPSCHPRELGETTEDGDGLADGQELFVKSVKTPKRYPTRDSDSVATDKVDLALGGPGWAIKGIDAMVGFTHEDMGQLSAYLYRTSGASYDRSMTLRLFGNSGQVNNFTSYDLRQKPALGGNWLSVEDFPAGRTWYLSAYDQTVGKVGAIEYLQMQVTVHTLPNRADTDADGLNDSEELNLGSDGFSTDPWKTDTDGDSLPDNEYFTKGTSPVLADTDRDGVRDDRDLAPLGDLFVEVRIDSITVSGSDPHNYQGTPEPFVRASILGNDTYTPYLIGSGSWITPDPYYPADSWYDGHRLSVNVADDAATVDVTLTAWSYDSTGHNAHTAISLGTNGECSEVYVRTKTFTIGPPGTSTTYPLSGGCPGTSAMYPSPLSVTLPTFVPDRLNAYLIVPDDYAGIYNVTDSGGNVLSRRYVGEPRFVAILLNATTWEPAFHCYCGPPIRVSFLV